MQHHGSRRIKISLGKSVQPAGTIRTLNTSLNDKLLAIQKQMNDLASTWQSPGGRNHPGKVQ